MKKLLKILGVGLVTLMISAIAIASTFSQGEVQILDDGNFENAGIGNWSVPAGTMTKEVGAVNDGVQVGRITSSGGLAYFEEDTGISSGTIHRCTGWARSDGVETAYVYCGGGSSDWNTNSGNWEYYDITRTATTTRIAYAISDTGWGEFDDALVTEYIPLVKDAEVQTLADGDMEVPEVLGSEELADWDMEAVGTADWNAPLNNPTLSKEVGSPSGTGSQVLKIAYTDAANPSVGQLALTIGKTYRITGWFRGDGSNAPRILTGTGAISLVGDVSTDWEYFDITGTTASTGFYLRSVTSGAGWAEFDDISVKEITDAGTSDWIAENNAKLTKETISPNSGDQFIRVAYDGSNYPFFVQKINTVGVTYRVTGWARGDGTHQPRVLDGGGGLVWAGVADAEWQYFDETYVETGQAETRFTYLYTEAGYSDFDDILLTEYTPPLKNFYSTELLDGDMEVPEVLGSELIVGGMTAGGWTAGSSATLTNPTSDVLRIAYNAVSNPFAYQNILTNTEEYRIKGKVRANGVYTYKILDNGTTVFGEGSTTTDWVDFDFSGTATSTLFIIQGLITSAGHIEYKDVTVKEITDGGTSDWAIGNGAILTKESGKVYDGEQVFKIAYNGVNSNPYAYQNIMTIGEDYRIQGFARANGGDACRVASGGAFVPGTTTATDFTAFDYTFEAAGTSLRFYSVGTNYCEFDDIFITQL